MSYLGYILASSHEGDSPHYVFPRIKSQMSLGRSDSPGELLNVALCTIAAQILTQYTQFSSQKKL